MNTKFEIGKTYETRSVGDYNCIFSITVLKRTAKTITIKNWDNREATKRVKIDDGVEYFHDGSYSMAPIFKASKEAIAVSETKATIQDVLTSIEENTAIVLQCVVESSYQGEVDYDKATSLVIEKLGFNVEAVAENWADAEKVIELVKEICIGAIESRNDSNVVSLAQYKRTKIQPKTIENDYLELADFLGEMPTDRRTRILKEMTESTSPQIYVQSLLQSMRAIAASGF